MLNFNLGQSIFFDFIIFLSKMFSHHKTRMNLFLYCLYEIQFGCDKSYNLDITSFVENSETKISLKMFKLMKNTCICFASSCNHSNCTKDWISIWLFVTSQQRRMLCSRSHKTRLNKKKFLCCLIWCRKKFKFITR